MKTLIITKTNGLLSSEAREYFSMVEDGKYRVTIEKIRPTRSLQQNKYYWGVCVPIIGEWMGHDMNMKDDKEFVHEVLKSYFLKKKVIKNPLDKRKRIVKTQSTSDLDTKEFTQFIDDIRAKFAHLNIPAPDSKEALIAYDYYMNLYGK